MRRVLNTKRFLFFVCRIGCADEIVVRRLRRWHQRHDLVAQVAVGASKFAVVPDFLERSCKGSVVVAVHGSLVVHAAGDEQDAGVDLGSFRAAIFFLDRSIERAVGIFHRDTARGMARGRGPLPKNAGMSRVTVPLWQLSERTKMRTPGLNLLQIL